MTAAANIVVTCTQRKSLPVLRGLHAGALRGAVASRLEQWLERLKQADGKRPVSALDLYAGDAWTVVKSLARGPSPHWQPRLWVCSAGYGLVPVSAFLSSYGATFAEGGSDSVVAGGANVRAQRRAWWRGLCRWRGPDHGSPRAFVELAARHPRTPLLFVGSQPYLDAVGEDLQRARATLSRPDLLCVLSGGASMSGGLAENILPYDGRFQQRVGGAMTSLNVRVLAFLHGAHKGDLTFDSLARTINKHSRGLQDMPSHNRQSVSDDEVRAFVKGELDEDAKARHTPLLRKLRDSGRQCEQARFRRIYAEVKETHSGKS